MLITYVALQNPFYYGEFQYGDKWYKGTHTTIITKTLFEKVQIQLQVAPKQWNKQLFPFKKICKCGSCGGSVTADIKYRRTKSNQVNTHIYYHCNRIKKYDCKEPYITEQELIKQLIGYLPEIKLNTRYLLDEFETEVKRLQHFKATMIDKFNPRFELTQHNTRMQSGDEASVSQIEVIREYLLHVLQYGTPEERLKILGGMKSKFELKDRHLIIG
ncbi:recombinase zinc beta ribbon domain-containing protein [Candidatus Woesebacteria bacterium]|nr:recombinase zinc beta ribbon domain-containing protein [Candidatus Woesebacteria bacterium]